MVVPGKHGLVLMRTGASRPSDASSNPTASTFVCPPDVKRSLYVKKLGWRKIINH